MKIFPAIDIRGGNAVRLYRGDCNKEKIYSLNPVDVAAKFKAAGGITYLRSEERRAGEEGRSRRAPYH